MYSQAAAKPLSPKEVCPEWIMLNVRCLHDTLDVLECKGGRVTVYKRSVQKMGKFVRTK